MVELFVVASSPHGLLLLPKTFHLKQAMSEVNKYRLPIYPTQFVPMGAPTVRYRSFQPKLRRVLFANLISKNFHLPYDIISLVNSERQPTAIPLVVCAHHHGIKCVENGIYALRRAPRQTC